MFNLILIFFAKACPLTFENYRKNEFRRKKLKLNLKFFPDNFAGEEKSFAETSSTIRRQIIRHV